VTVPTNDTRAASQNSAGGVFFGFGSIGPSGFIAVIGILVGIVVLAGITVFSSGIGFEGVHILFLGGAMIGIWFFLSTLEGFVSNSPTSFFVQMNSSIVSMGGAPIGTGLYVLLTFMYLVGFVGMVKRGG
jgi:hypothetical protein